MIFSKINLDTDLFVLFDKTVAIYKAGGGGGGGEGGGIMLETTRYWYLGSYSPIV